MDDKILLAHGSGGKLTHRLLKELVLPILRNPILDKLDDSAVLELNGKIAFTTDSFVVKPLFFPGGDIGKLAVCGTINDLAVMGAKPLYLVAACIVEEGFATAQFKKIIQSMAKAASAGGVKIIGGDLKVVDKKSCDGIFINTSGLGIIPKKINLSASNALPGDVIIINGSIGEHAAAVMAARQDYQLEAKILSDCAALHKLTAKILKICPDIHVMRDPTRGGVATTLNEITQASGVEIEIQEENLLVKPAVKAVCEILGIDPLYMACEGRVLIFTRERCAKLILSQMQRDPLGKNARIIGRVTKKNKNHPLVLLRTPIGSTRILDMLTGEQLPRIC